MFGKKKPLDDQPIFDYDGVHMLHKGEMELLTQQMTALIRVIEKHSLRIEKATKDLTQATTELTAVQKRAARRGS